jgi:hypothetical protein
MWILSFWIFPVISGCMWIGKDGNTRRIELTFTNSLVATLVALLSRWAVDGKPHYTTMSVEATIP